MANLPESATWEAGIIQLETTDPVVGGVNGKSNAQAKLLANRTSYLKVIADGLGDAATKDVGEAIDNVLTRGSFGIGVAKYFTDFNAITTGGFYETEAGSITNSPDSNDGFFCIVVGTDENFLTQIAVGKTHYKIHVRNRYSGTWSAWYAADGTAGQISAFAMNTAPYGWLACSGQAVLRASYARLFAAIGTTFGSGDGSTTFNLPDLRGEFIRGWDNGRGVDAARAFGSAQAVVDVAAGSGENGQPRNIALLYCIKL